MVKQLLLLVINGAVAISINWICCIYAVNFLKIQLVIIGSVVSRFHKNENKNSNFLLK